MSVDQAAQLRLLVTDECQEVAPEAARAWRTLSIYGAKGGVGTTTVALNLAVALCVADCRVELAGAAEIEQEHTAREAGPAGVVLLDAERSWRSMLWGSRRNGPLTAATDDSEKVDWLVVDRGVFDAHEFRQDVLTEERVLIVTTTEPPAVLAAFDALRSAKDRGMWPELVFNRVTDPREATVAAARMRVAAARLLGGQLAVHYLMDDSQVLNAARTGRAVTLTDPNCPFSRGAARWADHWTSASPARAA